MGESNVSKKIREWPTPKEQLDTYEKEISTLCERDGKTLDEIFFRPRDVRWLLDLVKEQQELIHWLACQSFGRYDRDKDQHFFDHMCLSTYEHTQDFLLKFEMISETQCERK